MTNEQPGDVWQVIEAMRQEAREWRGLNPMNNRTARRLEHYAELLTAPPAPSGWQPRPVCEVCGRPATCFGAYETPDAEPAYACDSCCAHGNEDGRCNPVCPTCGAKRETDPITAAVDAQLGPLGEELKAIGRKLCVHARRGWNAATDELVCKDYGEVIRPLTRDGR